MKSKRKSTKSCTNLHHSSSTNSSFSNSSFIKLKDGTVKRIRNKSSYKDIYLEKLNFIPVEMPKLKRKNSNNNSMFFTSNENSFDSSSSYKKKMNYSNIVREINNNKFLEESEKKIINIKIRKYI